MTRDTLQTLDLKPREEHQKKSSSLPPLDEAKLENYRNRSVEEWQKHIEAELVKFNDSPESKKLRNNYLNYQTRYMIRIIQEQEKAGKGRADDLRNLVININSGLIGSIKKPFVNKIFKDLSDADRSELESAFDEKAVQVLNSCITRYKDATVLPVTYFHFSLEKAFISVWNKFWSSKEKATSLNNDYGDPDSRQLGQILADKKAEDPVRQSIRAEASEKVRAALKELPKEWSGKTNFPLGPRTLLCLNYGIFPASRAYPKSELCGLIQSRYGTNPERTRQRLASAEKMLRKIIEDGDQ